MDSPQTGSSPKLQLALGTISFAVCFAAWGLISAFAPRFRKAFHLTATETAFLVAVPECSAGVPPASCCCPCPCLYAVIPNSAAAG